MKKWIQKNKILFAVISASIISFVLWLVTSKKLNWDDFFLNLLAGFVSSIFTILVIDRLLKREQLPLQMALYLDVKLFVSSIIELWNDMYAQSIEKRSKIPIEELFSEAIIKEIYYYLDLDGHPNIIPRRSWLAHIIYSYNKIEKCGEKILDRYINIAPPEIIQTIHYLVTKSVFVGEGINNINMIMDFNERNHRPVTPMLISYNTLPTKHDYNEMIKVIKWCKEQFTELSKNNSQLTQIHQHVYYPNTPPSSIITADKKMKYDKKLDEWEKSHNIIY